MSTESTGSGTGPTKPPSVFPWEKLLEQRNLFEKVGEFQSKSDIAAEEQVSKLFRDSVKNSYVWVKEARKLNLEGFRKGETTSTTSAASSGATAATAASDTTQKATTVGSTLTPTKGTADSQKALQTQRATQNQQAKEAVLQYYTQTFIDVIQAIEKEDNVTILDKNLLSIADPQKKYEAITNCAKSCKEVNQNKIVVRYKILPHVLEKLQKEDHPGLINAAKFLIKKSSVIQELKDLGPASAFFREGTELRRTAMIDLQRIVTLLINIKSPETSIRLTEICIKEMAPLKNHFKDLPSRLLSIVLEEPIRTEEEFQKVTSIVKILQKEMNSSASSDAYGVLVSNIIQGKCTMIVENDPNIPKIIDRYVKLMLLLAENDPNLEERSKEISSFWQERKVSIAEGTPDDAIVREKAQAAISELDQLFHKIIHDFDVILAKRKSASTAAASSASGEKDTKTSATEHN